jgi:hypothetical protein
VSVNVRLPIDIYSPDQSSGLLLALHQYIEAVHQAAVKAKVENQSMPRPEMPAAVESLATGSGADVTNLQALDELYSSLEAALKTAPNMHITLSAIPGRTIKRQLTVWFRTQIHPMSLLTFSARSDIGGGIVLQAGSHLYDYSFRQRILANPKRIGELANV